MALWENRPDFARIGPANEYKNPVDGHVDLLPGEAHSQSENYSIRERNCEWICEWILVAGQCDEFPAG